MRGKYADETNAKLQKQMAQARKELNQTEYTGTSQYLVKVTVNGKRQVLNVEIKTRSGGSRRDVELLQDLVLMATNDALTQAEKPPTTKQCT